MNIKRLIGVSAFVFALLFLTNCSKKENRKLLFQKETDDYSFRLYTVDNKYDESGRSQCSNYSRSSLKPGLYSSYGLKLKGLLAFALHTNQKYIDVNIDSLYISQYLVLDYTNVKSITSADDTVLINCLCDALKLKVKKKNRRLEGYNLNVLDSSLLRNYQTDNRMPSITYKGSHMQFEAMKLLDIAQAYDGFYTNYIGSQSSDTNSYTIEIPTNIEIEELSAALSIYGLELNPDSLNKTVYRVSKSD